MRLTEGAGARHRAQVTQQPNSGSAVQSFRHGQRHEKLFRLCMYSGKNHFPIHRVQNGGGAIVPLSPERRRLGRVLPSVDSAWLYNYLEAVLDLSRYGRTSSRIFLIGRAAGWRRQELRFYPPSHMLHRVSWT